MKYANTGIVLFLAAIFLFSGIDKLLHYDGFVNALRDYVLIPRGTAKHFALPVTVLEILIGIGLLVKSWRRSALLISAFALAMFTTAIILNYQFGHRGVCGCWFTITLAKGTGMHIVQNLLLLILAIIVWWEIKGEETVQCLTETSET
ncbi:MAG: DoxX family membrane protein [bacterium]|nr:DoxX family membrane protein [bacterium]